MLTPRERNVLTAAASILEREGRESYRTMNSIQDHLTMVSLGVGQAVKGEKAELKRARKRWGIVWAAGRACRLLSLGQDVVTTDGKSLL